MKIRILTLLLTALCLTACAAKPSATEPETGLQTVPTAAPTVSETTQPPESTAIPEDQLEDFYLSCDADLLTEPRQGSPAVKSLGWNQQVQCYETTEDGWSALWYEGETLYVKALYLSPRPLYELENDFYLREDTALRSLPETSAQTLQTLEAGTKLPGARTSVPGWYLIETEAFTGYLPVDRLSQTPPAEEGDVTFTPVGRQTVYTIDSVNYRTGPDVSYQLLGEIPAHVRFIRIAEGSNGWDKVIYNGIECCVAGNYLTTTPPSDFQEPEETERPAPPEKKPEPAPDGHIHVYEDQIIPPTCIQEGYTNHACSCGEQYADTFVPPLGHDWGPWTESRPATKDAPGEEVRTCSRCPAAQSRATDRLPADACVHQWAATDAEPKRIELQGMVGLYEQELQCSLCGETKKETIRRADPQAVSQAASELFSQTNALRAQEGLEPFRPADGEWTQWAQLRAREQAQLSGHTRPDGSSWTHQIGSYYAMAENVASTSRIYESGLGVHFYELYRDSPPHKANLLSQNAILAVGIYVDPDSGAAHSAMVMISAPFGE